MSPEPDQPNQMEARGSFKLTDDQRLRLAESLRRSQFRFRFLAYQSLGASAVLTIIALVVFLVPESLFEAAISRYRHDVFKTTVSPAATPKPESSR
jgi:hypothetical protein